MADLNEVRLIGRLTRDPVVRMTPSGQQVSNFGLATGRKFRGQDGVMREETTFVDITCWAKLAELVSKYLRKGRQVFVAGRLKFDTWDDRQSGQKRSKLSVVAENVQFLDRREDSPAGQGAPYEGFPPAETYGAPAEPYGAPAEPYGAPAEPYGGPASYGTPPPPPPGGDVPPSWDSPGMDEPPF